MTRPDAVEAIRAEMVAQVHSINVAAGDWVAPGDTVVVLESMKMEIPVHVGVAGRVAEVAVAVGDVVHEGDLIVSVRPETPPPGIGTAALDFTVSDDDTAIALGSGDVAVLATPRLLAWLEAATVVAVGDLGPGRTSVGSRVELDHRAATPVGASVRVSARLASRDGRLLQFEALAEHDLGGGPVTCGHARITRVAVDVERFLPVQGRE